MQEVLNVANSHTLNVRVHYQTIVLLLEAQLLPPASAQLELGMTKILN